MSRCNEPVPLYTGLGTLTVRGQEIAGDVTVTARWLPRPRTDIEVRVGQLPNDLGLLQSSNERLRAHLTLDGLGATVEVAGNGFTLGRDLNLRLEPAEDAISVGEPADADSVRCYILNLTWFWPGPGAASAHTLRSEHWLCELVPQRTEGDLVKQLQQEGGYALTHSCSITRLPGGSIDRAASRDLLHALAHFFGFIQGAWAPPLFAKGLAGENVRWREWYHRYHQPWQSHGPSWFDVSTGESVPELFPGFMAQWESDLWRDSLRSAIYWYIQCNRIGFGIDGALILAQAALERLAWTYVLDDKRLISVGGFRQLSAADQIRMFLTSAGVPVQIAENLPVLRKHATAHNWIDGVQAIVEVRNALIHGNPDARRRHFADGQLDLLRDAWLLALHLLELALLRICDYDGMYASRIDLPQSLGKVVRVPWATPGR
jgi:hypothetical protein